MPAAFVGVIPTEVHVIKNFTTVCCTDKIPTEKITTSKCSKIKGRNSTVFAFLNSEFCQRSRILKPCGFSRCNYSIILSGLGISCEPNRQSYFTGSPECRRACVLNIIQKVAGTSPHVPETFGPKYALYFEEK